MTNPVMSLDAWASRQADSTASSEWATALRSYVMFQLAAGRPEQSVYTDCSYLKRLAEACPGGPWATTIDELIAFMTSNPAWQPETRRHARKVTTGFFRWAQRNGRRPDNPADWLPRVRAPHGQPRPVPEETLDAALSLAGPRMRLMLMLGAYAGLRRAEIAAVHADDVVDGRLFVRGKGDRERVIPLHPVLAAELARVPAGQYAFPGKYGGHLSPNRVGELLRGGLGDTHTGHQLRHRFASVAYSIDRDLRAVQTLLGHTKPETTARYTALADGSLERAVMGVAAVEEKAVVQAEDAARFDAAWSPLVQRWQADMAGRGLAAKTQRIRALGVERFIAYLAAHDGPSEPSTLQRAHVEAFLTALRDDGLTPNTVATYQQGVRQFVAFIGRAQELVGLPAARSARASHARSTPAAATQPDSDRNEPIDAFTRRRLLRAISDGESFIRAWLWLQASGLQPAEISGLMMRDVRLDQDCAALCVSGSHARVVALAPLVAAALSTYLGKADGQHVLPGPDDPFFVWRDGTGPIPAGYIAERCRDHMKSAGFSDARGALKLLRGLLR